MFHRVLVVSDDQEFDSVFLKHLRDEGFDVVYTPVTEDSKSFTWKIQRLEDDLEQGQKYAIVAFGEAATHTLALAQESPLPHCTSLTCYYPTAVPNPTHKYPAKLPLLCHLASIQPFGAASFKTHVYPDTYPGFAESDMEEYDKFAAGLSWSRTLSCLRRGFGVEVDLEGVVDEFNKWRTVKRSNTSWSQDRYVNNVPTMTGGIGKDDFERFYYNMFMECNPPGFKMRLLSRIVGADKVVDEMMISFRHTKVVPWILPEVPPTNKPVEVSVVSIVDIRGGKLCQEQLYWDQASVLVQIGLLDPKLVPADMKSRGLHRLPITGREAAEKVLDKESHPSNELISAWKKSETW
ncbi:carboxymethylenebutenolidase [Aureobasidium sp. EXF-10728]|nr:carboxymethylenebutenolidase [Aureobasidium sp. EXF-10728]